jgi:sortase A
VTAIQRQVRTAPANAWGPLPPHATPPARRGVRRLERLLLVVGCVCLGYYGYVSAESALYQAVENRELDAILASAPATPPSPVTSPVVRRRMPPANGASMGRIEIPRLDVSAVIRAGSDARTLRLAVGYIPGTALPGEGGNIGLAAHRDTFFRRLSDIRTGDEIRIVTPEGTFVYQVQRTNIVQPKDTWVLNDTPEPALTLVTCYPFNYVGSAPQRFIVRAALQPSLQAAVSSIR